MTVLASDTFNRANGGLGANWTTQSGENAPQINTNGVDAGSLGVSGARYTGALVGGGAWPANQYSETVMATIAAVTDTGSGPACRMASGAQTHYFAQVNTTETRLFKVVAGSYTQLGADGVTLTVGDTLRLTCNGTTITVSKNGSAIIGPVTDSAIASGDAGIWCTSDGGYGRLDSFSAGDLTSTAQVANRSGTATSAVSAINGIAKASVSAINGLTI